MPPDTGPEPQDPRNEAPEHDSTNNWQESNPEDTSGPDSDFTQEDDMPRGKREDTGNQKPVEEKPAEQAEEKRAALAKPVGEKLDKPEVNSFPDGKEISERLKKLIKNDRKGLQKIYVGKEAELDKILKDPIEKGEKMARKLIEEEECTREIAKDLTVLTLYDVAILIDDSDSMIYEENGNRKKALIEFIDHITKIYRMANKSGILGIRFMNGYKGKRNWTEESSRTYLDSHKYGGLTRIGSALKEKILDKFAIGNSNQSKPLLVLIVTDGAVEGEKKGRLEKVIRDCVNEREGSGKGFDAVTFQFSRIGNDSGATKLLEDLDRDPQIGKYIDVLPVEFDPEGEFPDKWFVLPKILLGAIIPEWDKQDDHNRAEVADLLAGPEDPNAESDWEE